MKTKSAYFQKTLLSALFLVLGLALLSCQNASDSMEGAREESVSVQSLEMADQAEPGGEQNKTTESFLQQKIIRNANMRFQVADYQKSIRNIETILKSYNAFIASSNESRLDNSLQGNLTIRVPAKNLDNLLSKLTEQSISLDYKNITSEDVTTEFVDISARLKAKEAVEQRYIDLLKQAKSIKDILEIENQLRVIREEIEGVQARINYINQQSALSTVTLEIYETKAGTISGNNFGVRILNALKTGWDMLLSVFVGVLYLWPFLLLIPIIIYAIRRFTRKYPPIK